MDKDDGAPVPRVKPSLRDNIKDAILYLGVAAGVASWIYGHAKTWVESAEFARYQEQQDLRARFQDDRFRAVETRVSEMTVKVGETSVRVENIQKSTDRIENKLDEKRRR